MAFYHSKNLSLWPAQLPNSDWRQDCVRELVSSPKSDIFHSAQKLLKVKTTCFINYYFVCTVIKSLYYVMQVISVITIAGLT